jgi:hypothetical protein
VVFPVDVVVVVVACTTTLGILVVVVITTGSGVKMLAGGRDDGLGVGFGHKLPANFWQQPPVHDWKQLVSWLNESPGKSCPTMTQPPLFAEMFPSGNARTPERKFSLKCKYVRSNLDRPGTVPARRFSLKSRSWIRESDANRAEGMVPLICEPLSVSAVSFVSEDNDAGNASPEKLCQDKMSDSSWVSEASDESDGGAAVRALRSPKSCSDVNPVIVDKISIGNRPGTGEPSTI